MRHKRIKESRSCCKVESNLNHRRALYCWEKLITVVVLGVLNVILVQGGERHAHCWLLQERKGRWKTSSLEKVLPLEVSFHYELNQGFNCVTAPRGGIWEHFRDENEVLSLGKRGNRRKTVFSTIIAVVRLLFWACFVLVILLFSFDGVGMVFLCQFCHFTLFTPFIFGTKFLIVTY